MSRPLAYSIPGMPELIKRLPESFSQTNKLSEFVNAVWTSNQGQTIAVPVGLPVALANEMTSKILEYREKSQPIGGTVEIKKVAEIRGSRFNTGKLRMDLLDPLALEGLAAVLTKGAIKYNAHNWRQGLPYMEIIASMQRHIMAISRGEDVDPETGLPHADHVQCNAMFLSNMMKTRPDMDDRWKPPTANEEIDWKAAAKKAFPEDGAS